MFGENFSIWEAIILLVVAAIVALLVFVAWYDVGVLTPANAFARVLCVSAGHDDGDAEFVSFRDYRVVCADYTVLPND